MSIVEVSENELSRLGNQKHKFLILYSSPLQEGVFKHKVLLFTKRYEFDPFTKEVEFITPKRSVTEAMVGINAVLSQKQEEELISMVGDLGLTFAVCDDRVGIDLLKEVYKKYRDSKTAWNRLLKHLRQKNKK